MKDKLRGFVSRPVVRYLAGVAAVGVALLLRETLTAQLGPDFPEYLLFYPTVMIVALLAGLWPALLANVAAAAAIFGFWFLPGRPPLLHIAASNFVGLVLFMVVCTFLSVVAELYRRSRQKAAAYDKERAERQAQEAMRRQAEMLKLSFDAIIVWRVGGTIESWNRGAEELYGYTEPEAVGRRVEELHLTPATVPAQELELALRGAGEWFGEVELVTKEGRAVVVSSRQIIGKDLDGIERVLRVDRDITDQKRVEEELRRIHDELEDLVASRTADLQRANRTLLMVSACDQALVQISDERELTGVICQIIQDEGGYPVVWVGLLDEARGALRRVASAGDRDGFLDGLQTSFGEAAVGHGPVADAVRTRLPVVVADVSALPDSAAWRDPALVRGYRSLAVLPLLNARTDAIGALVIHSDSARGFEQRQLTLLKELADDLAFGIASLRARAERDQAQRALELKASQLQALTGEIVRAEQKERSRIAQLLHDQIQQLLVATLYGLEGLPESRATEDDRAGVQRLAGLVRECIGVSRSLASELSHPAFTEPDLETALGWLGAWTQEKYGLQVIVSCPQTVTLDAEESRVTLLQAVREVLFNVVKHAQVRMARVDVTRSADGSIRVSVRDDGVGFDPPGVFSPGRASGGIGLFSMRERLELIGGGLSVDSAVGQGTRVSVWVPAAAAAPRMPQAAPRAPGPDGGRPAVGTQSGKIRVLLVDDHAVVRDGIALQLLQQPDIEVVGEASDGAAAIELVRALRPDVVTMDVNMPGMTGVEATRLIHVESPRTKIIGLSMSEEAEQGAAMKSAGAAIYLSKSASLDKLLAAIRELAEAPFAGETPTAAAAGRE